MANLMVNGLSANKSFNGKTEDWLNTSAINWSKLKNKTVFLLNRPFNVSILEEKVYWLTSWGRSFLCRWLYLYKNVSSLKNRIGMYCSGYCFNEVKQNSGLVFYVFSETDIELKNSIIRTNYEGFENRNCIYIYFEVLKKKNVRQKMFLIGSVSQTNH